MRNENRKKYCVSCLETQIEKQSHDLVPVENNQVQIINGKSVENVQDLELLSEGRSPPYELLKEAVIISLKTKLYFLVSLLNNESDVLKINEILSAVKLCLDNLSKIANMNLDMNMNMNR